MVSEKRRGGEEERGQVASGKEEEGEIRNPKHEIRRRGGVGDGAPSHSPLTSNHSPLPLRRQWSHLIHAVVDGGADALDEGCHLRVGVVFQLFELVVEEHAAQRIKCCHTSL